MIRFFGYRGGFLGLLAVAVAVIPRCDALGLFAAYFVQIDGFWLIFMCIVFYHYHSIFIHGYWNLQTKLS